MRQINHIIVRAATDYAWMLPRIADLPVMGACPHRSLAGRNTDSHFQPASAIELLAAERLSDLEAAECYLDPQFVYPADSLSPAETGCSGGAAARLEVD